MWWFALQDGFGYSDESILDRGKGATMSQSMIQAVEKAQLKTDLPNMHVGDTIDVHYRIIEGNKERVQVFGGVLISEQGTGINKVIVVRRIVANEGVERIIPVHSPKVAKIEVKRQAHVRRAKLYYLRDRVGKSRRLRDSKRGLEGATAAESTPVETPPVATATA